MVSPGPVNCSSKECRESHNDGKPNGGRRPGACFSMRGFGNNRNVKRGGNGGSMYRACGVVGGKKGHDQASIGKQLRPAKVGS